MSQQANNSSLSKSEGMQINSSEVPEEIDSNYKNTKLSAINQNATRRKFSISTE